MVNKIKYLGVTMTGGNIDLFKNNFEKLWVKIRQGSCGMGKIKFVPFG